MMYTFSWSNVKECCSHSLRWMGDNTVVNSVRAFCRNERVQGFAIQGLITAAACYVVPSAVGLEADWITTGVLSGVTAIIGAVTAKPTKISLCHRELTIISEEAASPIAFSRKFWKGAMPFAVAFGQGCGITYNLVYVPGVAAGFWAPNVVALKTYIPAGGGVGLLCQFITNSKFVKWAELVRYFSTMLALTGKTFFGDILINAEEKPLADLNDAGRMIFATCFVLSMAPSIIATLYHHQRLFVYNVTVGVTDTAREGVTATDASDHATSEQPLLPHQRSRFFNGYKVFNYAAASLTPLAIFSVIKRLVLAGGKVNSTATMLGLPVAGVVLGMLIGLCEHAVKDSKRRDFIYLHTRHALTQTGFTWRILMDIAELLNEDEHNQPTTDFVCLLALVTMTGLKIIDTDQERLLELKEKKQGELAAEEGTIVESRFGSMLSA